MSDVPDEAQAIRCVVNTQHDCVKGNCKITTTREVAQEREKTSGLLTDEVQHSDSSHYVINTGQMRDAAELQPLMLPLPSFGTREDIIHHSVMQEIDRVHRGEGEDRGGSSRSRSRSQSRSPSRDQHASPARAPPPTQPPSDDLSSSRGPTVPPLPSEPSSSRGGAWQQSSAASSSNSLFRSAIMASYRQPSMQGRRPAPHDMAPGRPS